jgi:hypothetical protein
MINLLTRFIAQTSAAPAATGWVACSAALRRAMAIDEARSPGDRIRQIR